MVGNQSNDKLAAQALTAANTLGLEPYRGASDDEHDYLAGAYHRYIGKMLSVGLGGTTISYTKLSYTFRELYEDNGDFAARFEAMFGYLKKDKAALALKPRYGDQLPVSIDQLFSSERSAHCAR